MTNHDIGLSPKLQAMLAIDSSKWIDTSWGYEHIDITRRWRFPSGCSDCNGKEAHTLVYIAGEHRKLVYTVILFSKYTEHKYLAKVPVCNDCALHWQNKQQVYGGILHMHYEGESMGIYRARHATFRKKGTQLHFGLKSYRIRFDEINA